MSSTSGPCAACKFLRRKCTPDCIFAPYFPSNNPERFISVHRIFGASNVSKLLNELPASQREEMVKSLAFEAEARINDPVYGCTLQVHILQQQLRQRQDDLAKAKRELSAYINPEAIQGPPFNPQEKPLSSAAAHLGPNVVQSSVHLGSSYGPNVVQSSAHLGPSSAHLEPSYGPNIVQSSSHPEPSYGPNVVQSAAHLGPSSAHLEPSYGPNVVQSSAHLEPSYGPNVVQSSAHLEPSYGPNFAPSLMPAVQPLGAAAAAADLDPEQQELLEAEQLATAVAIREQQQAVMMRNFIQQQQQEYLRHNPAAEIEPVADAAAFGGDFIGSGVFGLMGEPSGDQGGEMAPCLGLGTFDSGGSYHHQLQQQPQHGLGENYLDLATLQDYPVGGQFLLPSEQQPVLPLTRQQQKQLEQQVHEQQLLLQELQQLQQQQQSESDDIVGLDYNKQRKDREVEEAAFWSWIQNQQ